MRFNKKLQVVRMLANLLEKKVVYSFNLATDFYASGRVLTLGHSSYLVTFFIAMTSMLLLYQKLLSTKSSEIYALKELPEVLTENFTCV